MELDELSMLQLNENFSMMHNNAMHIVLKMRLDHVVFQNVFVVVVLVPIFNQNK